MDDRSTMQPNANLELGRLHAQASQMRVHTLLLGSMQNFVYLLEDPTTRRTAVIDPGWDVEAILKAAEALFITDILITHWHEDHINGVAELVEATGARLHLLEIEARFYDLNTKDLILHTDCDIIPIGKIGVRILHTPGHSPGSACYYAGNALFTGDTLFVFGCGRCDLPGGNPISMFYSLRRLQELFAPEILIYPGHHYAESRMSTLGAQILMNPFLHQASSAEFARFRAEHNKHRLPPYQPVMPGQPAW